MHVSATGFITGVLAGKVSDIINTQSIREERLSEYKEKDFQKTHFCHRTLKERAEVYDGELRLSPEMNWGKPVGDEVR